ncbi:MAG TPA: bifunctional DNA primase/polymerase [Chitinophaga sp.]|uniref:bifunctional DNA primase/polymerase n=1 Tax=Chitinophaga sp. TaxID=1869181 RepID=UPI002BCEAAE3|nr:bifunctional DNA primase/polymerase [Chitinophaga sp.]HVI46804.1 bifunctional DNA primase/polymerase [Chitinophaga sp.]
MTEELWTAAQQMLRLAISVIVTDLHKKPVCNWQQYTQKLPGNDELKKMFGHPDAAMIAAVCGAGYREGQFLEIIDIDQKHSLDMDLYIVLRTLIDRDCPGLHERLVVGRTPNKGYHLWYYCREVLGNTRLASRPATAAERKNGEFRKVLIETRGTGGIAIAPPSPGYRFIQGGIDLIPEISPQERYLLHRAARSLDQAPDLVPRNPLRQPGFKRRPAGSPLDDYNDRGDVITLLQQHGWTVVRKTALRTYLRRPGQTSNFSSGDYNHALNLFGVFSTSTVFVPGRGYRPAAVFALLQCRGDFKEAARKLRAMGYGAPPGLSLKPL